MGTNTCPKNIGTGVRSNYLQENKAENKLCGWKKHTADFKHENPGNTGMYSPENTGILCIS